MAILFANYIFRSLMARNVGISVQLNFILCNLSNMNVYMYLYAYTHFMI